MANLSLLPRDRFLFRSQGKLPLAKNEGFVTAPMKYLIQMSGMLGSGKSSVARALTGKMDALVLDHDDTKSAILNSGVSALTAGAAS